jgi:muramoyltetrapeptide carboxypeptidase
MKIGVVAPSCRLDQALADRVQALAARLYPGGGCEIWFHPQCFLSAGHFAGDDATRAKAFLEVANDPAFDALWFGRGGYGANRPAAQILDGLTSAAADKAYLGYSDAGFLLAGLYKRGFPHVAHGPMPADLNRGGGAEAHDPAPGAIVATDAEACVARALAWLMDRAPASLEGSVATANAPTAAFNLTILSHLIGTPLQPDLTGHVLMLEEVSEHMYRIDRALFHVTSNPEIRRVAGIRLGRCGDVPENDPAFGMDEAAVAKHWCAVSGVPYLGRADIGHDVGNRVVPFGGAELP